MMSAANGRRDQNVNIGRPRWTFKQQPTQNIMSLVNGGRRERRVDRERGVHQKAYLKELSHF